MRALCGFLFLVATPLAALQVEIVAPEVGEPIFGTVDVVVEVESPRPVRQVEIFLDGEFAGRLEQAPWRFKLDVGTEVTRHRIEVVARDVDGAEARDVRISSAVKIDQEIDVELQQLYVTVTRDGAVVSDLARSDFLVEDDGVAQQLVTFERGDVPLAALLLVDSSNSMRGERLRLALEGAQTFVDAMARLDEAMLLLFSDHIVHATPFTGFARVLTSGLEGAEAGGGTALCDHLYAALELLETRQGRRVVILLSDGVDTTSVLGMDDVAWAAERGRALVYWLRLRLTEKPGDFSSAWRDAAGHRQEVEKLERLVRRSGGRIVPLSSLDEAAPAFADILAELRGQYVLGYYPEPRRDDGRWRRVRVRAGSGLEIRAREGYVDD